MKKKNKISITYFLYHWIVGGILTIFLLSSSTFGLISVYLLLKDEDLQLFYFSAYHSTFDTEMLGISIEETEKIYDIKDE